MPRRSEEADGVAKSCLPISPPDIVLPLSKSRLFDHPSALGIIAARAAALLLMRRDEGVMAPRDGVRPERARLGAAVARERTIAAAIGARALQPLWIKQGAVRGHAHWRWAANAARASHGRLIVLGNRRKFFRRVSVRADTEDNIGSRRGRWELDHGGLLGVLCRRRKAIARESLFGID